jgi:homeobox-leucine zipper protein
MELGLSLGETRKPFSFLHRSSHMNMMVNKPDLGFCMVPQIAENRGENSVQLDLLPLSPVSRTSQSPSPPDQLRLPWLTQNLMSEPGKGSCLNRMCLSPEEEAKEEAAQANSGGGERGGSSRGSDDEDINGLNRKKLRLTKDQSVFLEESFKEHNTLNPKQKQALARQLNLRPRQVEVWFQNRRARTKLKQTEVDCEYLKKCCETLTEENKRLQKEVQELRALKSSKSFFMNLPATTLTMCPSCERVAATSGAAASAASANTASTTTTMSVSTPKLHPFLCGGQGDELESS